MKLTTALNVGAMTYLSMVPATTAFLQTCNDAVNAMGQVPVRFIEHLQREACAASCEPTPELWNHSIKHQILGDLIDDGARYCDIDDDRVKSAFVESLDQYFDAVLPMCSDQLDGRHLCDDSEVLEPFIECIRMASGPSVRRYMGPLLPYINEDRCRKSAEYFESDLLWEEDFPTHIRSYVDQCHDIVL